MTGARDDLARALDTWGLRARRLARMAPSAGELGNQAWHVWTLAGRHLVARRHTTFRSRAEVAYELEVLQHVGRLGWPVPVPAADVIEVGGRQYSLCAHVAGGPCDDSAETSRDRGAMLARLHVALLPLRDRLGQRPCWRVFRAGMIEWALSEGIRRGPIDRDFIHAQLHKLRLGLPQAGRSHPLPARPCRARSTR